MEYKIVCCKRKDKRWQAYTSIKDKETGKRVRIYKYGKTESEAKKKLKEYMSKYYSECTTTTTFYDWLKGWA